MPGTRVRSYKNVTTRTTDYIDTRSLFDGVGDNHLNVVESLSTLSSMTLCTDIPNGTCTISNRDTDYMSQN